MNPELLFRVGSAQRLEILMLIKRSEGRTVGELADRIGMSYMGVKAHCEELRAAGLCESRKRPGGPGRPELIYRVTEKGQNLFPAPEMTGLLRMLAAAAALYGPSSPEKLLVGWFHAKEREMELHFKKRPDWTLQKRVQALCKIREKEGAMPEPGPAETPGVWIEFHNTAAWLEEFHPIVARLEEQMLSRILGAPVQRSVLREGSQRKVQFQCAS